MSIMVGLDDSRSERVTGDDIILQTRQVMKGLEALRSENWSIRHRLQEALLKEQQLMDKREGPLAATDAQALELLEEKQDLICRSLEDIELGIAEGQVPREPRERPPGTARLAVTSWSTRKLNLGNPSLKTPPRVCKGLGGGTSRGHQE
ncbi:Kinesin light chain 3, partial [Ophiophagus hannah]